MSTSSTHRSLAFPTAPHSLTVSITLVELTPLQTNNVIVLFRLVDNVVAGTSGEDGAVTAMAELTMQAQDSGSPLYGGLVTDRIDPAWGVVAVSLDASLRLTTAIEIIGGDDVREG